MPFGGSCVETFILKGKNERKFNFEANCIETALVRFGKGRHSRFHPGPANFPTGD
ncbi:hypothetical protein HZY62_05890 [Maribacter polysiphoniae]|uniref:Cellulose/xylan binding protein with CBM9 domain n=1 Tax=Maribacter polysiphoniae TaxID=429344 RepID=A0A316E4G6_9FLAO|nr:hypothetical protein [Maribacter polysiphoniae]PWK25567.1 cellulose/xylan binding protein with CBM9 domain [Maribacter polysiphoniae]